MFIFTLVGRDLLILSVIVTEWGGNPMKERLRGVPWARIIGLISTLLILLKVAQRKHLWPF